MPENDKTGIEEKKSVYTLSRMVKKMREIRDVPGNPP